MSARLVLVTSSFPLHGDGSEAAGSFVADLAEELARNVDLRVVAPGPNAAQEQWSAGLRVHRFAAPPRPLSTLRLWHPLDLAWVARVLKGGMQATREATGGIATTHILALWGLPCGEWARRVAAETRSDYSVWLLGSDVWTLGRLPIVRGALGRVIREARHAFADGYLLADEAGRISGTHVGFLPSARRIDLTGVTPPRTRPPFRLLFLGRWHSNKGVDLLVEALKLLDDNDWRHIEHVRVHGGGPLESEVRSQVRGLREGGRPVEVGGFLGKAEAEAAIAASDWVLIPSRVESIPLVFSDAMKLGRPVIATPVGDLPQLISGGCGELCAAPAPAAIAAGIRRAVHGASWCDDAAIKSNARAFSLEVVADRILRNAGVDRIE